MKLFRYGEIGQEKPGIIMDGKWLNVSPFMQDYNESFFENGGLEKLYVQPITFQSKGETVKVEVRAIDVLGNESASVYKIYVE